MSAKKRVGKGKKTGRLPDTEYYRWNTLPHDLKLWEYCGLITGVTLQCIGLVIVVCMVASGAIMVIDYLLDNFFNLSLGTFG